MDMSTAAALCAPPLPSEHMALSYQVSGLNHCQSVDWLPGVQHGSDVTLAECFSHIRGALYDIPRAEIPPWACGVRMRHNELEAFNNVSETRRVVDTVSLKSEDVICDFMAWAVCWRPEYGAIIAQRIVDNQYKNQYYLLFKALNLGSKQALRRHVLSPLKHLILNMRHTYPNVECMLECVVARERAVSSFPEEDFMTFMALRGSQGTAQAFADLVNLVYTYKQQESLGRLLTFCFSGCEDVLVPANDTWRILRSVSPLNDWLPGLNVRHKILYDSVLEVLFDADDNYMDEAFVAQQMRAVRGTTWCSVYPPSRKELLEAVSNSYEDQISAFVRCCLNRKKTLHKTIFSRIDALNIPNAFQLKYELCVHMNNKPPVMRSPFSDYLKNLQKCYPDLPYMTHTLTHVEIHKGNLTRGDFVSLYARAIKDSGVDTVEQKVTSCRYGKQALLDRAVDRLVECVLSKYSYAKLEEFGHTIAFCLIPICRFQEKHDLRSDQVKSALGLLSRTSNPALISTMDPEVENLQDAIPNYEALVCPKAPEPWEGPPVPTMSGQATAQVPSPNAE